MKLASQAIDESGWAKVPTFSPGQATPQRDPDHVAPATESEESACNEIAHLNYVSSRVSRWGHQPQ
jgi:hypothetical protein